MKLNFELVPDSCWCSNLRSALPKATWDKIRKKAYARAGGKCSICKSTAFWLEAHERWAYDDEKCVQKLEDVIAVCPACHKVIHIGRTTLMGEERQAEEHFMKVNGCSYAEYKKTLGEANKIHRERSKKEWLLDVSRLNEFL